MMALPITRHLPRPAAIRLLAPCYFMEDLS